MGKKGKNREGEGKGDEGVGSRIGLMRGKKLRSARSRIPLDPPRARSKRIYISLPFLTG